MSWMSLCCWFTRHLLLWTLAGGRLLIGRKLLVDLTDLCLDCGHEGNRLVITQVVLKSANYKIRKCSFYEIQYVQMFYISHDAM